MTMGRLVVDTAQTLALDTIEDIAFVADGDATLRRGKTVSQTIESLVAPSMEGAKACLIVMRGREAGRMYELKPGVTYLGRSDEVDVPVDDSAASRRHATIHSSPIGYVLTDLQSTNGTFVNGKRVASQVLKDGDRVQVGTTNVLKFAYQDELEESLQKRLYESATRDPLVNAYNKQYFLGALDAGYAHSQRKRLPMSVAMIDLDHFKQVNDKYGHLAGDLVLKQVVMLIKKDIRTEDVLARFGGEEFVLLLQETPSEAAYHVCERIRGKIEALAFNFESQRFRVTVSIGLATYAERNYPSPTALVAAADAALYEAKRGGRNRTVWSRAAPQPAPAGE